MHAVQELFTEFMFHEVQLMSLYYLCVINHKKIVSLFEIAVLSMGYLSRFRLGIQF